jgi:hypothetical protein
VRGAEYAAQPGVQPGGANSRSGRYATNCLEFKTKLDLGLVAREIRDIQ